MRYCGCVRVTLFPGAQSTNTQQFECVCEEVKRTMMYINVLTAIFGQVFLIFTLFLTGKVKEQLITFFKMPISIKNIIF